jgi:hypothetical protein
MADGGRIVRGIGSLEPRTYRGKPVKPRKYGKYGNIKTQVDGIKFSSKREAARYGQLKLLESAGRIRNLKLQVKYVLELNGTLICRYISDFNYDEFEKGVWTPVVEDCKGFRTPEYKLKAKMMLACHGIVVRET